MSTKKKLLQAAAGSAGSGEPGLEVDKIFSTHTYNGTGSPRVINNGIPLTNVYAFDYTFDGTQTTPQTITPNAGSNLSTFEIEFWMRASSPISGNQWMIATSQGYSPSSSDGFLIGLYTISGYPTIAIAGSGFGAYGYTADTEILANKTYHIVVSYNGSLLRVYIDGEIQGIGTGTTSFSGNTVTLNSLDIGIGSSSGSTYSSPYGGDIYGVSVSTSITRTSNFTPPDMGTGGATLEEESGGGMVWIKNRENAYSHHLYDTERGAQYSIDTDATTNSYSRSGGLTEFLSNGFSLGNYTHENSSSADRICSWTFRKTPKFFDVVTYSGTGSTQNISHSLDTTVGFMLVKETSSAGTDWAVFHRSVGATKVGYFNATIAFATDSTMWNNTAPTSSVFTVGSHNMVNQLGRTYVAYLFAHNDGDGTFGASGDLDVIKCGTYTGTGSAGNEIDIGFQPQFLITRNVNGNGWAMWDTMRGTHTSTILYDQRIYANANTAENTTGGDDVYFTPNGFGLGVTYGYINSAATDYIYIAIRANTATPTNASDVFDMTYTAVSSGSQLTTPFAADLNITNYPAGDSSNSHFVDRVRGFRITSAASPGVISSSTIAEGLNYNDIHDVCSEGFKQGSYYGGGTTIRYQWKRAPGYFDIVSYIGNGTLGHTVKHNLGVAPEMMWMKRRNSTANWLVYHSGVGATKYGVLSTDGQFDPSTNAWNNTAPTDTEFTVGTFSNVNTSGSEYIAYLFASVDGVSKVGTFAHTNGFTTNVDCGFSNGARFVMLKRYDGTGSWVVLDTKRGIGTGNDSFFALNNTTAEVTGNDVIDPYSAGFTVDSGYLATGNWVFYAIA